MREKQKSDENVSFNAIRTADTLPTSKNDHFGAVNCKRRNGLVCSGNMQYPGSLEQQQHH
jgi:hypothetical protein